MSAADFDADTRGYEDEVRDYDRERQGGSPSPRGGDSRARSASPNGRDRSDARPPQDKDDDSLNPGTNLFVTGIHPRLSEAEVTRLFEKYGDVEKCNIMRDPHSGESRGFGFVKMVTAEHADAARNGLQGVVHEGRTLSIEKARRARPRTPTPGKYYGPPKREFGRPRGGRFEDRRGGSGRRDDFYGGSGSGSGSGGGGGYRGGSRYGGDRYEDRGEGGGAYERRYRDRGEYGRSDRYGAQYREDRYGGGSREERYGGREERRGGYYGREDRNYEQAPPAREGREGYSARGYDDRGDEHHSR